MNRSSSPVEPLRGIAPSTLGPPRVATLDRDVQFLKWALYVELVLSVLEGPIRLALYSVGLDAAIFVRDALVAAAVAWYVVARLPIRAVPAPVGVFVILIAIHGTVSYLNLHTFLPSIYEVKMLLPALAAFLVPEAIFKPSRRVFQFALALWIVSVLAAAYDQWVMGLEDFPWVGINTDLGGIQVFLGRDWQAGLVKRVGGLTRASINLAIDLPVLAFMVLSRIDKKSPLAFLIYGATIEVLVLTTQKGGILGFAIAALMYLMSGRRNALPLKAAVLIGGVMLIFVPVVLPQFRMPHDRGVFSFESLIERIDFMWPLAWDWINRFPPILGIGLGGIGGAQRFFAPAEFNPADNLFIYLYANFGAASVVYLAGIVAAGMSLRIRDVRADSVALAALAYLLFYGLVISLVEDQIASICFGAVLGWIMRRDSPSGAAGEELPPPDARPPA